jgi:hypothetical protein
MRTTQKTSGLPWSGMSDRAEISNCSRPAEAWARGSIVYRALLESILDRAQSKAYPHAARYLRRLGKLAKKIRAWLPIAPHESYLQPLRARHDRKRAFWAQVSAG